MKPNLFHHLCAWIICAIFVAGPALLAQDDPVFNQYNMQPEVWHFSGYPRGQVDHKGDLNLSLPVMTVPGRGGLSFEIAFNYHAPIQKNQQAGWIGLGWSFDPGSITRDPQAGIRADGQWVEATHVDFAELADEQPDMYYLTLPGKGTQPFSRSNNPLFNELFLGGMNPEQIPYEPLNQSLFYTHYWKPWKIDAFIQHGSAFDIDGLHAHDHHSVNSNPNVSEITRFQVITEDGMRYVFAMPTFAWYRTAFYGGNSVDQYISVWRLTAILSPEVPPEVTAPDESTPGNWVKFSYRFDETQTYKTVALEGRLVQNTYLWQIETPTHYARFTTGVRDDVGMAIEEIGAHRKLNRIELFRKGISGPLQTVQLQHSQRLCTLADLSKGKTTLEEIAFLGREGVAEPGYRFQYVDLNPRWSDIAQFDFFDDHFGYYTTGGATNNFDADSLDGQAWSLKTVCFPGGGSESYEYENDEILHGIPNRHEIALGFKFFNPYSLPTQPGGGPVGESAPEFETRYYPFSGSIGGQPPGTRFRQGGSRVRRITRNDANGNVFSDYYYYGIGYPTGVPGHFFASYGDWAYYTPGNRGQVAVIYDRVRKVSGEVSEETFYSVPNVFFKPDNPGEIDSLAQIDMCYVAQSLHGNTLVMGNEDVLWGHAYRTVSDRDPGHHVQTERQFRASLQELSSAYEVPVADYGVRVKWLNLFTDTLHVTENGLTATTFNEYRNGPRLLSRSTLLGSKGERRVQENTYAHQIGEYGGSAATPGNYTTTRMRAANLLDRVALERRYIEYPGGDEQYHYAAVTSWKAFPAGEAQQWQPYRLYHWLRESPQPEPPDYTAWHHGSDPGAEWQLQKKMSGYDDFGQPLAIHDGNGNITELFYGDNQNNFSNTAAGWSHAYLTGVRKAHLFQAFDYDGYSGLLASQEDGNGAAGAYYYDFAGRLAGVVNAGGLVTHNYTYFVSGDTAGSEKNYVETLAFPNGNYLKNSSFEINSPETGLAYWQGSNTGQLTDPFGAVLGNAYGYVPVGQNLIYPEGLNLPEGGAFIVSLWVKSGSSSTAKLKIRLSGGGQAVTGIANSPGSSFGNNSSSFYLNRSGISAQWERVWVAFRTLENCNVQLRISCTGGLIHSDDVILAPLEAPLGGSDFPVGIEPRVKIDYYDGLGQLVQTVSAAGPYRDASQIITARDNDRFGRVNREWKPFPSQKTDARSALGSYEPLATASGSPRSAFGYYNGDTAPDGGDYPFTRYVYGLQSDYRPFTFFPGQLYHLPENIDPFSYPYLYATNLSRARIRLRESNRENDLAGYASHTLRKQVDLDEHQNYRITLIDKAGNKIHERAYHKGHGPVWMRAQVLADAQLVPADSQAFSFQAIVTQSIDVHWLATFSNQSGLARLKFGTSPGGSDLASLSAIAAQDTTVTIFIEAGKTYHLEISAAGFGPAGGPKYRTGERKDRLQNGTAGSSAGAGSGGVLETDRYVSSWVDFYYNDYAIEYYTPAAETHYQYDGSGNLVGVLPPNYFAPPANSDSGDWAIRYEYNTLGLRTGKHSPDAGEMRYRYDRNGNTRFVEDANLAAVGRVQFTSYDFADRVLRKGVHRADFDQLAGDQDYAFESDSTHSWILVNRYDSLPAPNTYPWNAFPGLGIYRDSLTNLGGRLAAEAYKIAADEPVYVLILPGQAVTGEHFFSAADSLIAGPGLTVTAAGDLTLEAGREIILKPGFHALPGSGLQASVRPALRTNPPRRDLWQLTLLSYDRNGKIDRKYLFTPDLPTLERVYHYNAAGEVVEAHDRLGGRSISHFYEYNAFGQLAGAAMTEGAQRPQWNDIGYRYNEAGMLDTLLLAKNPGAGYAAAIPYRYHIRDWVTQIGDPVSEPAPFSAIYEYLPNGMIAAAGYYHSGEGSQAPYRYEYAYDGLGRLTGADYLRASGGGWENVPAYDVDALSYDGNGNITRLRRKKENGAAVDDLQYTYQRSNRLQSLDDAVPLTDESWDAENGQFSYDPNGNLASIADSIQQIDYDSRNLPVRLVLHNGTTITYRYNAAGQRIYQQVGNLPAAHYLMDGDRLVAFWQDSLQSWSMYGNALVGRLNARGEKYFYIKDHLGSTRSVVKADGSVAESHDYYPFGLQMPGRDFVSGERTRELFNGKMRDSETGWDYFGARYYSAATGRWFAVDPFDEHYPSLGPYTFTANNPVMHTDTDGRWLDTAIDLLSLGISLYDLIQDPVSLENWVSLGLDLTGVVLPGVAGLGMAYKGGKGAKKAVSTAKNAEKALDAADAAGDAVKTTGKTRDACKYTFRGDRISPQEVFENGFQTGGSSNDLVLHVLDSSKPPSNFVSTSKSSYVAVKFAGDGGYVYIIRPQNGIDVNRVLGADSFYPRELEVAIPGGVRSSDIMGARQVGEDGSFIGEFIPNPNFKK